MTTVSQQAEAYTPVCWDGAYPLPEGMYGTAVNEKKTPAQQRHEATRIFQFLSTANGDYDMLVLMTSPVPLLIQVPGTNKVRFICGVAPYRGDPQQPACL